MAWEQLCVGVASGMVVQDIRDKAGQREGDQTGRPGGKSLPFLGKVSGHGQTYDEEGRGGLTDGYGETSIRFGT